MLDVISHRVLCAQSVMGQAVTAMTTTRVSGQLMVLFGTGAGQVGGLVIVMVVMVVMVMVIVVVIVMLAVTN